MKFELKSIKHARTLSEETNAFTANIYLNGKRVGWAKNDGQGGETLVDIDKQFREELFGYARVIADTVIPNPVDFSVEPVMTDTETIWARMPAKDRAAEHPLGDLVSAVDTIIQADLILREVKAVKRKVSCLTTDCKRAGQYVTWNIKLQDLTEEKKAKIASDEGFVEWLYDKEPDYIAKALRHVDSDEGPLCTRVEFTPEAA